MKSDCGEGAMNKPEVRELRAVPRYNVQLPVNVTWPEADAPHPPLQTFTRDISTRGMFVFSDAQPEAGSVLEFKIDMADEQTPVVGVRGAGRVVRTERPLHGPSGFAVHNVWFRIGEPGPGRALEESNDSAQFVAPISSLLASPRSTRHRGLTVVPRSTPKITFGSEETK
jgi:PilZ domain